MRKLALPDEILLSIQQPARYIGGEVNMCVKDPESVDIRFCMCFPDVYEIGMSHLGLQILYDMFNKMDGVYCERVFSPWTDLDQRMRKEQIPLFALESQDPVRNFDFLGITLQYEMCYTNILQILELSRIPLHSVDRTWDDPIVIGGGPCAYNPEPLADFFDLFYIGEGETVYADLLNTYKVSRAGNDSRDAFLKKAAQIPGIYVPSLYEVQYNGDGTIRSFLPSCPEAPKTVIRQVVTEMTDSVYPEKPLVPFIKVTQDRVVLEIMRGCIRGCRFCQAGMIYRPVREKNVERLKELAWQMLKNTGHEEISLSSLSSSDYRSLEEIVNFLIEQFQGKGVNISLPSLRIDAFSLDVMSKVQDVKKSSLTFAPEAGTQRLRDVINKGLSEEEILNGAFEAFQGGWNRVKLYFMLGLPTETTEDIEGIALLSEKIAERYYEIPKDQRTGKVQVVASTSFFVPKPFTPFQWAPMSTKEEFLGKARIVNHKMKEMLNHKSLKYNWHEADVTVLEGVLARGDRRVSKVIEEAYRNGALYDAWSEAFRNEIWMNAFETCGVDIGFYTSRERNLDEIFPWDFIDTGISRDFLKREWERARDGVVTPNCREHCSGCGVRQFGGGVCYEDTN
ncbi:TIGR03960 family B12-binding radical SAM protein [bacterium 1XD42-94]|nr:TIGR03960 family B12-binding radical SAM protein [bacterium 1XD42-76]NBK03635.1 TIGR03960 family B12-binding radical SAM protein [bacterium 1XD42-94]